MKITFFIVLNLICLLAKSESLLVLNNNGNKFIGKYTSYLKDSTKKLSIEDVLKNKDRFIPYDKKVFSSTDISSAYWIHFQVMNNTLIHFLLIIDNPFINEIEIYSNEENKIKLLYRSGNSYPFERRGIKRNNFIVPINLPKGEVKSLYIRYSSTWRMEIPLSFQPEETVIENFTERDFWYGILYGLIIMTFLYNLFLYILIREKSRLLYIGLVVSLGLFRATNQGHSFEFLFPEYPILNNWVLSITYALTGVFIIHFTIDFLKTSRREPLLHKGLYFFDIIFILSFLISIIHNSLWNHISNFILFLFPPYLLFIGIRTYFRGYTPAKYYCLGTISYFSITLIAALRNLGILHYSFLAYNFGDIGLSLIVLFYAIALADKYNFLNAEKKKIKDVYNKQLKIKIDERLKEQNEIEELNKNLQNTNNDLDSYIYTASHNLKSPISNIQGLINLIHYKDFSKDDLKKYVRMMREQASKFIDTVKDFKKITQIQQPKQIEELVLTELIEELKLNLTPTLEQAGATLNAKLNCSVIHFSKDNLMQLLTVLINNSIKYRSDKRPLEIIINSQERNQFCILTVKDNGLGISKEYHHKIFSLFRRAHAHVEGKGLGLYIAKRMIENAGGKIEMESEEDKYTLFNIYFRK